MNKPEPIKPAKNSEGQLSSSPTRTCQSCGLEWDRSVATCPHDGTALLSPIETDPAFNKYEFIEVCGSGGMGVVYKARQTILDKVVAIKMLHSGLLSPETFRRFQIEGKSASMLEHPYIIKVHDLGVSASGPYMILEYVKGRTLAQVLQLEGPLSVERFLRVFIQVCSALEHAHNRGVFHRDLKPTNIMLTRSFNNEEEIRIMDFGIAKLIGESDKESLVDKLTRTGEALGSPAYMSPEQAQGGNIDARSDLYSVGCVMFESLTGAPPFNKTTSLETLMAHISEPPMTMTQAVLSTTKFDESLEMIVARLLQKDPDRRYQSMQELQNHLIGVREGKALEQFVYRQGGNNGRLIVISCIVTAAVACIIFMLVLLIGKPIHNRQVHVGLMGAKALSTSSVIDMPSPISAAVANNNKELTLGAEGFTVDEDLAPLANDKTAEKISLRKANISGLGLKYLAKIPTLKELNLSNSTINTLEKLSDAHSLETLELDDTLIGDIQLEQIKNLRLKSLDLSNTSVSTLNGLRDMKSLTNLRLNFDKHLNTQGMAVIGQLKNLEQLDLDNTTVTDADLAYLVPLRKLQALKLYACKNLSDAAVNNLKKKLPVDCVVYYDVGHQLTRSSEPGAAEMQTLADEKSAQTKEKASLLKNKALRLWQNHRYKDALDLYKQVLPILQNAENKTTSDWSNQAECLRMIGNCHYLLQQMQPAIPYYRKAIDVLEKHTDSNIYDQLPYWCYELGVLYDQTHRKKDGLAMYLRANELFNANHPLYTSDSKEICKFQDSVWQRNKALNLFGVYTDSVISPPTAANDAHLRSILQEALDICHKDPDMQNSLITANYYYSLGDLYTIEAQRTADAAAREHCFVRALENYQRCKDIAVFNKQDPHLPGQLGAALIGIGSVNLALKHYDRTEEIFKDMLEHSKDKSFRIVALRNLSAVCYYEHRQAERNNYEAQLARLDKK
jgi:serine/threonine protein kinase/tetratricopeptide (TPR) repeat protein